MPNLLMCSDGSTNTKKNTKKEEKEEKSKYVDI